MKDFRKLHLKYGMSYIEVVAAITIFATFGSSLFFVQNYLFNRVENAQWQLFADIRMRSVFAQYQLDVASAITQKKSIPEKQEKEFTFPDMRITLSKVEIDSAEKSNLEKYSQAQLMKVTAQDLKKYATMYAFMYVPNLEEKI